jgi:hypothetical protein
VTVSRLTGYLRWGGAMAMLERGNGGRKRKEGVTDQSSVDGQRVCFPAELTVGTLALVRCRPELDWCRPALKRTRC